ncbi:probable receptor-like protein kinase At5g24010 [Cornus florida]|uniref:probable receptor-like protein kinase At5g24010 n=1 Tax=Cornus florida TaxID=4283 RepID=UPI0028A1527D|nr:probable receptor-like protein kinase At5g24010 [Cornus florida]
MENLYPHHIFYSLFYLLLLLIFQFSSISLLSSAYTLPDIYFINCGSDSNATVNNRNFVGDATSASFGFSAGQSSPVKASNSSTQTSPGLYQTARVVTNPSSPYELDIQQNGTYMVRFHFYPFSSPKRNLFDAQFDVLVSGFSLLSNFTVKNSSNSPVIKEFLLTINVGKFKIYFRPSQNSSFAFVNAIEVFIAPANCIPDSATLVTPSASNTSNYNGLLSRALHTIHRINVGGVNVAPNNDTLLRSWVPDDDFLFQPNTAKNSEFYNGRPVYGLGKATEFTAPDFVYKTAKEMNIDSNRGDNFFNITWRLVVNKNARHFVRVHFCDIVSYSLNTVKFNLYLYSKFSELVDPYEVIDQLAAPFYFDFVVDSDNSGYMNISVGPRRDSFNQTAFLNGLEIMELMKESEDMEDQASKSHMFIIIICSVVGGVAFVLSLMGVLFWRMRCRKAKAVESVDWPLVPMYGGSSYGTERTPNGSTAPTFYLGLKVPIAEILHATNNFDTKLMIGEGGFGKVYKGTLRSGMKVAVKRSHPGHGQGIAEFQTEIMVLSKIRHRHLVSLIGYCDEGSEMILVYEFMEKGTLRDHLYVCNEDTQKSFSGSELSWNRRLEICIGAAKGLHYLHTGADGGIIHRDVKSTNILLDEQYVAKVADFGLSRSGPPDQTHVSTDVKGSFGYLDPEYFRYLQLTQKSDVYSFGVVLLEVLCARPALNNLLPRDQINLAEWGMSWLMKGELEKIVDPILVGKINPNSLRKFGETAGKCLKEYGAERPNMHDVLWDLEYALQLQQTARNREPHEDSTTDASWVLPMTVVQRLPSQSIIIDESINDGSDTTLISASEVFSQLKIDDAR